MKIGIISLAQKNYSTRRLVEAAFSAGHIAKVLDPFGFCLHIGSQGPRIYYEDTVAEDFDVVLPRLFERTVEYGAEVVSHFQWIGTPVINRSDAIINARNKFCTLRTLAKHGLPVPPSFTVGSVDFMERSVNQTGEYPFIMKPFEGTHGNGILLLDTPTSLRSAIGAMCDLHQNYIIQPFIKESAGNDLRVIVIGEKAVAAMKRVGQAGEFRANIHRGGHGQPIELQGEYAEIAIRAAKVMSLEIAGVDLLQTNAGPLVLEVNPSPGIEEIEEVTGIKIAEAMIAFAVEYCVSSNDLIEATREPSV